MFPYTVCLYISHVPFGVKIATFFTPAMQRVNRIAYWLVYVVTESVFYLHILVL